ncbi:MFS transporter [Defluviicoccus vanus]|uniref:MFS transporter n=2 Tax=Defluviicoccus vanus TaxID=111831 RepID=A0A7H1N6C6_9PROT|nr:MFS transporter [Defluviicoccus vanus]
MAGAATAAPSPALLTVIAVATGALVANLYYAQPLVATIAPEIGIRPDLAGSIVSVAQIGYGLGLLLLVSLADLVENKMLVLLLLAMTTAGVVGLTLSTSFATFAVAAFVVGLCATSAQVLIPYVARLVADEQRGRIVGNIMAGVLTGIMLARPVSLFVAASFGWRAVFWGSAGLMLGSGVLLARMMPRYRPAPGMHYGQILASMVGLMRDVPAVRWRSAYQALLFAAFNMLWTAAPMMLTDRFGMSNYGIGLFALAGAGGALAAPLAGRLADRGHSVALTAGAMLTLALAFFLTPWVVATAVLALLVVLTIGIDAAVQTNHVVSQRLIFAAPANVRGRVNALYMTIVFAGGAAGSMLGTLTYHMGTWTQTALVAGALGAVALVFFGIEQWLGRKQPPPRKANPA